MRPLPSCGQLWLVIGTLACGAFPQSTAENGRFPAERWNARLAAGELTPEQIADGAAQAQGAQEDKLTTFDSRWGDFMELARKKDALSDDLWRKYLLGALRPRHRVAPGATRQAGLPRWIEQEVTRAGSNGFPASVTATREDDLSGIARESKTVPSTSRRPAGEAWAPWKNWRSRATRNWSPVRKPITTATSFRSSTRCAGSNEGGTRTGSRLCAW